MSHKVCVRRAVPKLVLVLVLVGVVKQVEARIIVFRNDAKVPISFSLRQTTVTDVITETLEVGGKIQFDLPETGRFDICAKGLDGIDGTFGETGVGLPELLARMVNNEVGVDGILCGGRRLAILLKFPLRDRCSPYVLRIGPAGANYIDWFYHGKTVREPQG